MYLNIYLNKYMCSFAPIMIIAPVRQLSDRWTGLLFHRRLARCRAGWSGPKQVLGRRCCQFLPVWLHYHHRQDHHQHYHRGFGGVRIEDDVLVTATGCENFTLAPREVADVEVCRPAVLLCAFLIILFDYQVALLSVDPMLFTGGLRWAD